MQLVVKYLRRWCVMDLLRGSCERGNYCRTLRLRADTILTDMLYVLCTRQRGVYRTEHTSHAACNFVIAPSRDEWRLTGLSNTRNVLIIRLLIPQILNYTWAPTSSLRKTKRNTHQTTKGNLIIAVIENLTKKDHQSIICILF